MALGCRFGPTLAISLVLFCAAGLTGGHEEHDPNYWNHQAHELLFEKKDYTMQKIVIKSLLYFLCHVESRSGKASIHNEAMRFIQVVISCAEKVL